MTAAQICPARSPLPVYDLEALPGRIRERITVHPLSCCWVASGHLDRNGYARHGGKQLHRVVFELLAEPIPSGLVLDHVRLRGCLFNSCCNPAHLEPVTNRTNVLRGTSFAAVNYAKTHCDSGHPYDLYNTYTRPNGHRDCRACVRARVRKYQRQRRAAARLARSSLARAA